MKRLLAWGLGFFNVMVVECAWCRRRRILGFKRGGKGITSAICPGCEAELRAGTWKKRD
jgi:hypothetical protein